MKKSISSPVLRVPFVQDQLRKQARISRQHQKRFTKLKDPQIVIDFVREHVFALKEPWVVEVVIGWLQAGKTESLKKAFLPHKGERPDKYEQARFDFFLMQRVDRLVSQGMSKTEAFAKVQPPGGTHLDPTTVRNIYYRARRKKPEIHIRKTVTSLTISAFPAKCTLSVEDQTGFFFGSWEMSIPL